MEAGFRCQVSGEISIGHSVMEESVTRRGGDWATWRGGEKEAGSGTRRRPKRTGLWRGKDAECGKKGDGAKERRGKLNPKL